MAIQQTLVIYTKGRELINITAKINEALLKAPIDIGLCHLFLHHTSASLTLAENADADVLNDAETFMQRLVPDGDALYRHTLEGPDDMSSHIRTMLTQNSLAVPIKQNQLALGTWQGIFLWEHRLGNFERHLTLTLLS